MNANQPTNEKKKSYPVKLSERPYKKHKDENPDNRYPSPDDPYKETGLPIKEMSITGGPHHPHHEEILGDIQIKAVPQFC